MNELFSVHISDLEEKCTFLFTSRSIKIDNNLYLKKYYDVANIIELACKNNK